MNNNKICVMVLAGLFGAATTSSQAADLEQRVAELERQAASRPATEVSFGGYIKADTMFTRYSDGEKATAAIGDDFLVPSTIPVGADEGATRLHMIAKQSRVWMKTRTPTDVGDISSYIELDFQTNGVGDERVSNSEAARLRHAYLSWDKWLFGQTWTTFFNVSALPETLDFVGAVGTVFVRQSQIRYTRDNFMMALENPSSTLYGGNQHPYDDNDSPDVIVRYNQNGDWGNLSLAAMGRQLAYRDTVLLSRDQRWGYGVSVAGQFKLGQRDDFRLQLNYGNALGRYVALNAFRAGQIEANGDIELIDQWAAVAALRHHWSDQWRSNLILSMVQADNPDTVAGTVNETVSSGHVNLIWQVAKPLILGGEVIYAQREDESGDSGDLTRLQFTARYTF